jgi:hypothetical protein
MQSPDAHCHASLHAQPTLLESGEAQLVGQRSPVPHICVAFEQQPERHTLFCGRAWLSKHGHPFGRPSGCAQIAVHVALGTHVRPTQHVEAHAPASEHEHLSGRAYGREHSSLHSVEFEHVPAVDGSSGLSSTQHPLSHCCPVSASHAHPSGRRVGALHCASHVAVGAHTFSAEQHNDSHVLLSAHAQSFGLAAVAAHASVGAAHFAREGARPASAGGSE